MRWYGLERGALLAIRDLLNTPLSFNAVSYVERTFKPEYVIANPQVFQLALLFDQEKMSIYPKVSGVVNALEQTRKANVHDVASAVLPFLHEIKGGAATKEISCALAIRACDSVNLQLDRMLESFEVFQCCGEDFNAQGLSKVLSFYLLSEVLFLVLTGVAHVTFTSDSVRVIAADQEVVAQLHRKWFANYLEQTSAISSLALFDPVVKGFQNSPEFGKVISLLGQNLRDKIFAIPAGELPGRLARLESVKWINKLCDLTALIMWCQIKNEMIEMPFEYLDKISLCKADIDWLKDFVKDRALPDRVFIFGNNGVRIDNPTVTVQLRSIFHDVASKLSDARLNELLGMFFEKHYIARYFDCEELSGCYVVHPGLSWDMKAGDAFDLDVDMIIEDLSRKHFFFVQVKYLRAGGKAYLAGDLDYVRTNKLSKGLMQLDGARQALECGSLNDWLGEAGLSCNSDNSSFLLIHNVTNFDFCVWPSGVVSYEWNTLRNLLKKGQVIHGHSQTTPEQWNAASVLPIEEPDKVIQHFMHNVPAGVMGGVNSLFESDHVSVTFSVADKTIDCQGLGL